MLIKEKLIESIQGLPAKFSVDEIIDRIILLDKIEKGLEQSDKGQIIPDEKMDKKLKKWLD